MSNETREENVGVAEIAPGTSSVSPVSLSSAAQEPRLTQSTLAPHTTAMSTQDNSSASCQCISGPRALIYALGRLGYDFVSLSRRESMQQKLATGGSIEKPSDLLDYLEKNPWDANDPPPGNGQANIYRVSTVQNGQTVGGYTVVIVGS